MRVLAVMCLLLAFAVWADSKHRGHYFTWGDVTRRKPRRKTSGRAAPRKRAPTKRRQSARRRPVARTATQRAIRAEINGAIRKAQAKQRRR